VLVFLAGPNGAGKSTFFRNFLEETGIYFVNGDVLAAELQSLGAGGPEVDTLAFRATEARREELLAAGSSFCIESVFSDPVGAKLDFLKRASGHGYAIVFIYIGLAGPDLSIARVMQRVAAGGHDVPDEKLRGRYPRTLANLRKAIPLVAEAFLFDNSSDTAPYRLVAHYEKGRLVERSEPIPSWAARLPGI
jgi:predicted ABC-type ATPase